MLFALAINWFSTLNMLLCPVKHNKEDGFNLIVDYVIFTKVVVNADLHLFELVYFIFVKRL